MAEVDVVGGGKCGVDVDGSGSGWTDMTGGEGGGGEDPLDTLRKRRSDRYDSSESSDSGVATLSPSSTSDTAPYSPSAESSCSSSDCSSSISSEQLQHPSPSKTTSLLGHPIMTAVSAVLAAADKRSAIYSSVNLVNVNLNIANCKVAAAVPPPPPSPVSNLKNGDTTKSSGPSVATAKCATGKDLLAVAISFHHQQQLQEKAKALNNNNSVTTLNKNNPPSLSLPNDLSHSPAPKKPRLESLSSPSKAKLGNGTSMPSVAKPSSSISVSTPGSKKVKRKLVETSESSFSSTTTSTSLILTEGATPTSVEATLVQAGRVCSIEESLKGKKLGFGLVASSSITEVRKVDICCLWKGCSPEAGHHNLFEHIQTVHVSSQTKSEQGFVCLWEGCKVFNRKSSSRSWLERHVLFHSGNKPFKCIFPGCGQSFGVQGALERHVNSHMSTNGNGALSSLATSRSKVDSNNSPFKGGGRRKKQRCRKQRLNIGQHVDYFDKRVMELIKHRLATSVSSHTASAHHCTFQGQVVAKRTVAGQEPQVLVQWLPPSIIPEEWMPLQEFRSEKILPLTQLPKEKLPFLFPSLFPPRGTDEPVPPTKSPLPTTTTGKARRKWSPSCPPSTSSTTTEERQIPHSKQHGSKTIKKSPPTTSSPCSASEEEDDWALDALLDNLFLSSVPSSVPSS